MQKLVTCLLCGLLVLAACSGDDGNSNDTPPAGPSFQSTETPSPLLIWHSYTGAEQDALEQIRLNFEALHPSIRVQIESFDETELRTEFERAVNAGEGPDLLFGPADWLMPLAMQGLIQPISQELFNEASNNLAELLVFATDVEGLPYGIVTSAEFITLYYNRAQIDTPADIFDDMLVQAQNHPFVIPPTFFATSGLFFSSGGLLMGNEADNRVTKSFLELFLMELQTLAGTPGIMFSTEQTNFLEGRAGFLLALSTDYSVLKNALGDDLGVASLPRFPPEQWSTLVSPQVIMQSLNSTAQTLDDSTAFVTFLISADSQRVWFEQTGYAPANPSGLEDNELRVAWGRTLEWSHSVPLPVSFNSVMLPALDEAVQAVVLSGADPETVATDTVDHLKDALGDSQ